MVVDGGVCSPILLSSVTTLLLRSRLAGPLHPCWAGHGHLHEVPEEFLCMFPIDRVVNNVIDRVVNMSFVRGKLPGITMSHIGLNPLMKESVIVAP